MFEWREVAAFCVACVVALGGCANGAPDSGRARPSAALIAEGAKAITQVCELDQRVPAARVHFVGRRAHEVLEFRLVSTDNLSPPRGPTPVHVFLYDFGSGTVSERAEGRAYCPQR